MTARLPMNELEARRLESLHALMVLDTESESLFDTIVRTAAENCGTPISLLTLIDADRQWFKANFGADGFTGTPRDISFCTHAICADEIMEVRDTMLDDRFAGNPLVMIDPKIRYYAGAPLILADGQRVGTLCVMDVKPRLMEGEQAALLRSLATLATQALELRRDLINRSMAARSEYEHALARSEAIHRAMVQEQQELVSLSNTSGELIYVNDAYCRHFGRSAADLIGSDLYVGVDREHIAEAQAQMTDVFETGQPRLKDFRTLDANGKARWVSWMHCLQHDIDGVPILHSVGRDVTDRKELMVALAEKERFIRQITDNLPLQVAYVDTERRYRFANQPHCRRLGHDRESMMGRTRSELTDGRDDAYIDPRMDEALAGTSQRFELVVDNHGVSALMETRLIPDIDDDGVVRGVFATAIDITAREASERSVRELLDIFDNTPDLVTQTDDEGMLTYMNPAARAMAGLKRHEPIDGIHYARFNNMVDNQRFLDAMVPAVKKSGLWLGETLLRTFENVVLPMSHMVIGHRNAAGRTNRYSTIMRNISEEVGAKHEQQRQAATLRSVAEAIPAKVAVIDSDGRYRFVNNAFATWAGMASAEIVGNTTRAVLGEELYERSLPYMKRAMAGEHVVFDKEPGGRNPDAHLSITYVPLLVEDSTTDGFVVVVQDVTRQKREENRLKHLSQRDSLTGLLNRTGLEMFVDQMLGDPEQDSARLGLLYIDLDRFKPVNDTWGHPVGDELLKLFGRRLAKLVRPTDAVVRLGGDEFAVVLQNVRDIAGISNVADKVVAMALTPFDIGGLRISIGASVGLALGVDEMEGWPGLLKRADAMLYKAKAAGRGRSCGESC